MKAMAMHEHKLAVITHQGLTGLIDSLRAEGFRVIGPTLRDQAIVYDEIELVADLPAGWTDEQDGGHYRVRRRDDAALFGTTSVRIPGSASCIRHCWAYGARSGRTTATVTGGGARGEIRLSRRALLRAACDRHSGSRVPARPVCRSALPGTSRGRLHRGGELRPGRRNLLLHLDEHRPEGAGLLRSRAHRVACRRRTNSWWKSAANAVPPCSPPFRTGRR